MLLPWLQGGAGSGIGISQPDGLLTLIVGAGAMWTAWRGLSAGWIVSGFLAVVLGRDISRLFDNPDVGPASGLWIGATAFAAASIMQLVGLGARVRSVARSDDPENLTGDGVDLDS